SSRLPALTCVVAAPEAGVERAAIHELRSQRIDSHTFHAAIIQVQIASAVVAFHRENNQRVVDGKIEPAHFSTPKPHRPRHATRLSRIALRGKNASLGELI